MGSEMTFARDHPSAIPVSVGETRADRVVYFLSRNWLAVLGGIWGLFVLLPLLAPLLMQLGWTGGARAIYFVYSFLCHQLPERSYFLFGQKFTYSLPEIQAAWQNTTNPVILRQFIGNPQMGWKVAWSDRMISLYGGIWIALIGLGVLRRKLKRLPWWGVILFLLPMMVDGTTHLFSDILGGMVGGFRFTNQWLAVLTAHSFPVSFYVGDAWGSFNSILRLLTGFLFAVGIVWFGLPYIDEYFQATAWEIEYRRAVRPQGAQPGNSSGKLPEQPVNSEP